jgi:lysozyme
VEETPVVYEPYKVTPRVAAELVAHEGLVREAYKDVVGVWTWGIGVTDASGHTVGRYRDNPSSYERVFEVFEWLVRQRYTAPVQRAFRFEPLSEEQFAAALSFHYNTGAIERASWVKSWVAGNREKAFAEMMNWVRPASLLGRRKKERALFFNGVWSNDGTAAEYRVAKPSYTPVDPKRVEVMPYIEAALG